MKKIDGVMLKKAIIFGINELEKNKELINSLNVFPVPDGDTGSNMTMTAHSAGSAILALDTTDIYQVAKTASSGALRGARGNSGVILSQLFRGFAKGLENKQEIDGFGLAEALHTAMEAAYKAVMKPKEGTILTIAKALAQSAEKHKQADIKKMLAKVLHDAHKTLVKTQFMLPELKEAKVVDAGGKGLLHMLEGALAGNYSVTPALSAVAVSHSSAISAVFSANADIKFAYCTEMFIDIKQTFVYEEIEQELLVFLDSLGDSIVLAGDENVVKIHVHTNNPGSVMEKALTYGDLSNIKVDNMRLQHEEAVSFANVHTSPTFVEAKTKEQKELGVLAVAGGPGLKKILLDLSVDYVIEGGQTMNPSTESFLEAIDEINAKSIIILPNNSNIILAAQQAQTMSDKNVHVLITKTVPEGIAAMYSYNVSESIGNNIARMQAAVEITRTGQITYAIKDSSYKNQPIKKGDILSILDGEINQIKNSPKEAALGLLDIMGKEEPEFISIYYGQDVSLKEAEEILDYAKKTNKNTEVDLRHGGQPLYYYLISAE